MSVKIYTNGSYFVLEDVDPGAVYSFPSVGVRYERSANDEFTFFFDPQDQRIIGNKNKIAPSSILDKTGVARGSADDIEGWLRLNTGDISAVLEAALISDPVALADSSGALFAVEKFGHLPDIDPADPFLVVWDGGKTQYTPPTTPRVHDVSSSDNIDDLGVVVSSGTATGGDINTLIDTGATFVTDGVAAGQLLLDDTNIQIGIITAVTETEITVASGMQIPPDGHRGSPIDNTVNYRVVNSAGAGGQVVWINGLNEERNVAQEFIVLNGSTAVPTTLTYSRQHRGKVFCVLANGGPAGNISSVAQTEGTLTMFIAATDNQTLMAFYTIPQGYTGYIIRWWGSLSRKGSSGSSTLNLFIGDRNGVKYIQQDRTIAINGSSEFNFEYKSSIRVPGGVLGSPLTSGSDIWVEADSDTNNMGVSAGFSIILKRD